LEAHAGDVAAVLAAAVTPDVESVPPPPPADAIEPAASALYDPGFGAALRRLLALHAELLLTDATAGESGDAAGAGRARDGVLRVTDDLVALIEAVRPGAIDDGLEQRLVEDALSAAAAPLDAAGPLAAFAADLTVALSGDA
jgi:hypothetical protein